MQSIGPRRAGAGLIAFLTAPSCRAGQRQTARQAWQTRTVSSTSTRPQQAATQPATSTPAPRATLPQRNQTPASATKSIEPDHALSPSQEEHPLRSLTDGLQDPPPVLDENERQVDWTRSYHGLSSTPFSPEAGATLQEEIKFDDIEIKPDGIIYLPEIKYRRILNRAFGPGGWGLAPRGETIVTGKVVTREYGLVCGGRYAYPPFSPTMYPL